MIGFATLSPAQNILLETLVWTAILIAAVLLVRRSVARMFGPQMAYALWAIPMVRLVLPPIELPGWMAPDSAAPEPVTQTTLPVLDPAVPAAPALQPAGFETAATDAALSHYPVSGFELDPFVEAGLAIWLIGAAIFLYLRFAAYFRLRDELLHEASEVGRNRGVRLIETPATSAPLAFGVIDKVIALPPGFLAQPDRKARDLALAHEMAHHRGRDLLVNVLVQPLFAMHWWNPLGRYGWLALRRDQEAACDARVMACAPREERERYANLIVAFAAGANPASHHALTAPMACPVLGEKSIIHRLRSLNMTETSNTRRVAGRLLLGAAVLALPLTATISYAASEAPMPPEPPAAPDAPGAPPAPPAPPPQPAPPGLAPEAEVEEIIIAIDPDSEAAADGERKERVMIFRSGEGAGGEGGERRVHRWVERSAVERDGKAPSAAPSDEEIEEIMIEVRKSLAEARAEMERLPATLDLAMAEAYAGEARAGRTVVKMSCDNSSREVATTRELDDGSRVVMLCQTRIMAHAMDGLREARAAIARNEEMSAQSRERIVKELDREIMRWEEKSK